MVPIKYPEEIKNDHHERLLNKEEFPRICRVPLEGQKQKIKLFWERFPLNLVWETIQNHASFRYRAIAGKGEYVVALGSPNQWLVVYKDHGAGAIIDGVSIAKTLNEAKNEAEDHWEEKATMAMKEIFS